MATQEQADKTLAFHQNRLFQDIPNLSKLSVVKDTQGNWIIEAGVIDENIQNTLSNTNYEAECVPNSLQIPTDEKGTLSQEVLPVHIVNTGEIRTLGAVAERKTPTPGTVAEIETLAFTNRTRPVNGGNSVGNCRNYDAGTFGSVVRLSGDTTNRYFLSNWHVLVGGSGRIGDRLVQPGRLDGGVCSRDTIGVLYWHLLDSEFDAALGQADMPWENFVAHGFRCYTNYDPIPIDPTKDEAVTKCGRTTERTNGTILSTNASVRVIGYPTGTRLFTNQIETTSMAQRGDSGSILFQSSGMQPVGLLFAGGSTRTYHNKLKLLFDRHLNSRQVTNANGDTDEIPEVDFDSL